MPKDCSFETLVWLIQLSRSVVTCSTVASNYGQSSQTGLLRDMNPLNTAVVPIVNSQRSFFQLVGEMLITLKSGLSILLLRTPWNKMPISDGPICSVSFCLWFFSFLGVVFPYISTLQLVGKIYFFLIFSLFQLSWISLWIQWCKQ